MIRATAFVLVTALMGCEDPDEPPEIECIESLFCCEYTCTTQAVIDERGPDPCDCDGDPAAPEGECTAVEEECVFVE